MKKREIILAISGTLFLLAVIGAVVYSINFLTIKIKTALSQDLLKEEEIIRFDFKGLEQLNIIDKSAGD